ncbi:DUF456 domain-containing protein [Georgenia sp. Z1491]|uniref:DUF456 domain-containing protein n=1 Tax=Georgenia sp. Z1491 TaxID=3416707 RepID=UPI003CFB9910
MAELLTILAIVVGLFGTVTMIFPGGGLVAAAVAIWGWYQGGTLGLTVAIIAIASFLLAMVLGYVLAGRYMQRGGVRTSTLVVAALAGVVGFFVVPVVGLVLFFVGTVFLVELARLRDVRSAWPATVRALKAAGLTILIELAGAMVAVGTFVVAWIVR